MAEQDKMTWLSGCETASRCSSCQFVTACLMALQVTGRQSGRSERWLFWRVFFFGSHADTLSPFLPAPDLNATWASHLWIKRPQLEGMIFKMINRFTRGSIFPATYDLFFSPFVQTLPDIFTAESSQDLLATWQLCWVIRGLLAFVRGTWNF